MELESALPPPDIRLNNSIRRYAFRALKLPPTHPISRLRDDIIDIIKAPPDIIEAPLDILEKDELSIPYYHQLVDSTNHEPDITRAAKRLNTTRDQNQKKPNRFYRNGRTNPFPRRASATTRDHRGSDDRRPSDQSARRKQGQLVYNRELEGVTQAIEYASIAAQPNESIQIYLDNQARLLRLKNPSDNPGQDCQIRAIKAAQKIVDKGASLTLNWVPGHTEVEGNEEADSLAKRGTKSSSISIKTSFASLGLLIRQIGTSEWQKAIERYRDKERANQNPRTYSKLFPCQTRSNLRIPGDTKRELASSFYQLKLGHGYIKSYLYRIKESDNDTCRCGKKETTEHLLLACPEGWEPRKKLKKDLEGSTISLRTLLHTSHGIQSTLEFLKKTRFATRKWHIERGEGSESREEERDKGDV
ncbi:hypothetical protein G7Y89_g10191 [Cudoniella acicularis]|uniref:ribonuclease H n=1 Tax=Cudoniella acicularis TaxID=354080 RepID=A0A8H4W1V7_9HELO|nr:hypothetical protein G7Y89_g10191 [Cudoniella acicularis]